VDPEQVHPVLVVIHHATNKKEFRKLFLVGKMDGDSIKIAYSYKKQVSSKNRTRV